MVIPVLILRWWRVSLFPLILLVLILNPVVVSGMLIIKNQAMPVLRKGSSVLEGSGGPA